jgi:catechol 2,3-dioxygenase-like lactoylglutathione lyase family enzyme
MSGPAASHPEVLRILETSLYVEDLDRSVAFYEKILGFPVILKDARMCALGVPGRQVLLLFRLGGSNKPSVTPFGTIPAHDGRGIQHVCFSVDRSALPRWRAHLETCDVPVESWIEWPNGGISIYFRDPDQHSIEVATAGLWPNDPCDEPLT